MTFFYRLSILFAFLLSMSLGNVNAADYVNGVTHLNQTELVEKLKDPNAVLIDIRTQAELNEGYIAGAVHLPISEIANDLSLLDPYLNKDLIFYCHVGSRVNALTNYLQNIGHPSKGNLFHLKGDIRAWKARGKPLVTP